MRLFIILYNIHFQLIFFFPSLISYCKADKKILKFPFSFLALLKLNIEAALLNSIGKTPAAFSLKLGLYFSFYHPSLPSGLLKTSQIWQMKGGTQTWRTMSKLPGKTRLSFSSHKTKTLPKLPDCPTFYFFIEKLLPSCPSECSENHNTVILSLQSLEILYARLFLSFWKKREKNSQIIFICSTNEILVCNPKQTKTVSSYTL